MSNRREFLRQTALIGGALALQTLPHTAPALGADKESPVSDNLPLLDTHQHLWDLKIFNLPWQKADDLATLRRSYVMSDYLEATRGLKVTKSIYMEVDVEPSQQVREAEYVTRICEAGDSPMAGAVVSGRPNSPDFLAYIEKFKDNRYIKGIRQVLHVDTTPAGYCLQPGFIKGIQILGENGKSFDFCMRAGELLDAAKVVAQCPKTRFIVDHCGNMPVKSQDVALRSKWKAGMKELAQHENVVCKVSGIVASSKPGQWTPDDLAPVINFTRETFGPDRVMFGGDWPVCTLAATYRQWVEALREIVKNESESVRRRLYYDNAAKFYGV